MSMGQPAPQQPMQPQPMGATFDMHMAQAAQQNPEGAQRMTQLLQQAAQQGALDIPPQYIPVIKQMIQAVASNPALWPQVYQRAIQMGASPQILPPPNAPTEQVQQFVAALLTVLHFMGSMAQGRTVGQQGMQGGGQTAQVQGFANGGVVGNPNSLSHAVVSTSARGYEFPTDFDGTQGPDNFSSPAELRSAQDAWLQTHPMSPAQAAVSRYNGQDVYGMPGGETSMFTPSVGNFGTAFGSAPSVQETGGTLSTPSGRQVFRGMAVGYATGGMVGIPAMPVNTQTGDNQLIAAQTGEGVLNRQAVQAIGGPNAVHALNMQASGMPSGGMPTLVQL